MNHAMAPKKMQAKGLTVVKSQQITPDMIRLTVNAPALKDAELPFTDHYIKLLFVPDGADYTWPFDLAEIREKYPRSQQPVKRTYSLRRVDQETGDCDIDFVIHGDQGIAGPWARTAEPGDTLGFAGPGGGWAPSRDYEHFVLAGDEAAAPAIGAALDHLPEGTTATAYVEVAERGREMDIPDKEGVELHWIYRDGATPGTKLSEAVRAAGRPSQKTSWFIHGVAEMIRELRRFLFVEQEVDRADASISGYWRLGMVEDEWQATKREFVESMEREEKPARP